MHVGDIGISNDRTTRLRSWSWTTRADEEFPAYGLAKARSQFGEDG
jgi:hypothetical protein